MPLAFVSPRIVTAVIDSTLPAAITATAFAAGLPCSWARQEQSLRFVAASQQAASAAPAADR
jgi:hypothetical protein